MRAVCNSETLQALRVSAVIASGANLRMLMIPGKLHSKNKMADEERKVESVIRYDDWKIDEM